jgi:hypothetical protein
MSTTPDNLDGDDKKVADEMAGSVVPKKASARQKRRNSAPQPTRTTATMATPLAGLARPDPLAPPPKVITSTPGTPITSAEVVYKLVSPLAEQLKPGTRADALSDEQYEKITGDLTKLQGYIDRQVPRPQTPGAPVITALTISDKQEMDIISNRLKEWGQAVAQWNKEKAEGVITSTPLPSYSSTPTATVTSSAGVGAPVIAAKTPAPVLATPVSSVPSTPASPGEYGSTAPGNIKKLFDNIKQPLVAGEGFKLHSPNLGHVNKGELRLQTFLALNNLLRDNVLAEKVLGPDYANNPTYKMLKDNPDILAREANTTSFAEGFMFWCRRALTGKKDESSKLVEKKIRHVRFDSKGEVSFELKEALTPDEIQMVQQGMSSLLIETGYPQNIANQMVKNAIETAEEDRKAVANPRATVDPTAARLNDVTAASHAMASGPVSGPVIGVRAPLLLQAKPRSASLSELTSPTPARSLGADGQPLTQAAFIKQNEALQVAIKADYSPKVKCELPPPGDNLRVEMPNGASKDVLVRKLDSNIPKLSLTNTPPSDDSIRLLVKMGEGISPLTMAKPCNNVDTLVKIYQASLESDNVKIKFTESDQVLLNSDKRYQQLKAISENPSQLEQFRQTPRELGAEVPEPTSTITLDGGPDPTRPRRR